MQRAAIILLLTVSSLFSFSLQSAKHYSDQNVSGWLMSEKLDGIRAFWDGKALLTKGGYKLAVPPFFLKSLPPFCLDGELWIKRGAFEAVASAVLKEHATKAWHQVGYYIFEVPFAKGDFRKRLQKIKDYIKKHPSSHIHVISQMVVKNRKSLFAFLSEVEQKGGEGVMIKNPHKSYFSLQSGDLLKLKHARDMEGEVIGIKKVEKNRLQRMKSLHIRLKNGITFYLGNGFSKNQRENPPKIGQIVTFKYFGWTKNGKPKFASFLHVRDPKTLLRK